MRQSSLSISFLPCCIHQRKRAPHMWGALFELGSLWVLVTQLTVVSEENQEIRSTNDTILIEILRTSVFGA